MGLLRHLRDCNRYDPDGFVPLRHDGARLGFVRRDNAEALRRFPSIFAVAPDAVALVAAGGFDRLSAIIDEVTESLVSEGLVAKWRNEYFAVAPAWGAAPHFKLDRGAVPFFGVRAYGVHLNGYVREDGALKLWVGRRSPTKAVAPDKLDNLVAGGIDYAHGLVETLVKESAEEASLPEALAAPGGAGRRRVLPHGGQARPARRRAVLLRPRGAA